MIKIGIEELSTTFTGLLLKYGICHVIFILEISLLNLLSTVRVIHVFMVEHTSFGKVKRKQQKSSIHAGLRRDGSRSDSSLSDSQGAEITIA